MRNKLSYYWQNIQGTLFPWLSEVLGELTEKQKQLIRILEIIRIEEFIKEKLNYTGRKKADRAAIARSFVAKMVYSIPETKMLRDRLIADKNLRNICGFDMATHVPSESVFSRAFLEFSQNNLPESVHRALIEKTQKNRLVGHISRDSTKIEVREKAIIKNRKKKKPKRGRPKKNEIRQKDLSRIEKQQSMVLSEMLEDLPSGCDVGTKVNSKGYKESWRGYKLHIDAADGNIPISCILTSASTHDSQVAIPLANLSAERVTSLYDLMDAAYDSPLIRANCVKLGHVPIIDVNTRRNKDLKIEINKERKRLKLLNFELPENNRYKERTTVERVNGRLKDEFCGRFINVRGHLKVMCHLMFGILALTADQLMKFIM